MDEPWRSCLALAGDAYLEGTIPVGAVVVDAEGVIVARGRNRIFAPSGTGLAGTRLAHAEVEALAQLPSTTRYEDHTVYSALEPCLLCVGAALMSTVGMIRYAARDVYGGACNDPIGAPDFVRRGFAIEGPTDDDAALIAAMLQSSFWLRRDSELAPGIVETFGDEARERAERLHAANGALPRDFDAALPRLRALL